MPTALIRCAAVLFCLPVVLLASAAAATGNQSLIELLPPISSEEAGDRAAIDAVQRGDTEALAALIQRGIDVNRPVTSDSWPLLAIAVRNGKIEVARQLIAAGADLNAEDGWQGRTPYQWAVKEQHEQIVELLAQAGADTSPESWFLLDNFRTHFISFAFGSILFLGLAQFYIIGALLRNGITVKLHWDLTGTFNFRQYRDLCLSRGRPPLLLWLMAADAGLLLAGLIRILPWPFIVMLALAALIVWIRHE